MAHSSSNHLRDLLYSLGRKDVPEYIFQWFFRYFAGGPTLFQTEPSDMLDNYRALFSAAQIMLNHKYAQNIYRPIIADFSTPSYTYYIVGDTHGSFDNVFTLIDYFVRVFQVRSDVKVVFIGDYVDRNPWDLQSLAFIIAFWLMFPENVFLLRGNHEDSSVCSRYGFSQHLYEKAGSKSRFNPVWDQANDFFSKLPIGMKAKVGDKNIVIFHGGIPFDHNNYQPVNLSDLEPHLDPFHKEHFDVDIYTQTILWADPDIQNQLQGEVAPTPRTGRPRFSRKAFEDFMALNQFDLLIRGHQKFPEGYRVLWDNHLISLFSTSTYDGRPIGQAKFFRLTPETSVADIGDEMTGEGKGILTIHPQFLAAQMEHYYHARTS